MPQTDLAEIRQLYASVRHPWLRRRLFDNVSQYLLHEAIHQRGEDDALAMAAHDHRMATYDAATSYEECVQQYVLIYSQLRTQVFIDGVRHSLIRFKKR